MEKGLDSWAALQLRRNLNLVVMQFKKDHPGVLESKAAELREEWKSKQIRKEV